MWYLAAEVGPHGVRVCGIWTAGVAETLSEEKLTEVGDANAPEPQAVVEVIAGMAALRRAPGWLTSPRWRHSSRPTELRA
ncbi:MAG: hypothetical protein M3R63_10055 [Actinomycetota bacterium]|nr:hypothetical protein [Actinomycetota bacterium]